MILILILSIMNSYSQNSDNTNTEEKPTVYDIQRNSLYLSSHFWTIDAIYERIIPIKNKVALIAGGGIIQTIDFSDGTNPVGKFGFMLGGYKHFFEAGIVLAPLGKDISILLPLVGYRYQNPKGFLFRIDVMVMSDSGTAKDGSGEEWVAIYPLPGFSLGYSF